MATGSAELDVLWAYFPHSAMNNPEMNALLSGMFKSHSPEVVRAVLHSHRLERKYNDPCIPTIKRMLDDARHQMAQNTATSHSGEDPSVRAMRAWAIARIGMEAAGWDARRVVKERIRAEWFAIPIERRPRAGTEMNFGPWLGMIAAAGGNTEAGRTFLESLTGCSDITKYDGLDNRAMFVAFQEATRNVLPRDCRKDVESFREWQTGIQAQKHKLRRAIAAHDQGKAGVA